MLKYWKKNGCSSIYLELNLEVQQCLKVMEKKITLEQNIKALKDTYEAGLATVVQLVIGMPGETDVTIEETIDFLKEVMKYYPDSYKKKISFLVSINYAQSLPAHHYMNMREKINI